jgi:uncharacterized protein
MEFDNTFSVASPIDEVWNAMLDVERVAPCVPGAQVLERTGENAYKVAIKVRLGPMTMTYRGDVEVVEADEAARRAVLRARATEARGQGTADATVELRLRELAGATDGTIHSDVAISGRAAAMGQGVIADVSGRLIDRFAGNLAEMLAAPAVEAGPATERAAEHEAAGGAAPAGEGAPAGRVAPAGEGARVAAGAPAAEAAPPERGDGGPAPDEEEGLSILPILRDVLGSRLRDPRALAGALAGVAAAAFLLGRRSARGG